MGPCHWKRGSAGIGDPSSLGCPEAADKWLACLPTTLPMAQHCKGFVLLLSRWSGLCRWGDAVPRALGCDRWCQQTWSGFWGEHPPFRPAGPSAPQQRNPTPVPRPQGSRTHKLCALPSAEPKPHCGDVRPQISAWHAQLQPCSVLATYHGAAASIPRCRVCPPAPLPGAFQEMLEMLKMLRNVPGSAPGRALGSSQAPAGRPRCGRGPSQGSGCPVVLAPQFWGSVPPLGGPGGLWGGWSRTWVRDKDGRCATPKIKGAER